MAAIALPEYTLEITAEIATVFTFLRRNVLHVLKPYTSIKAGVMHKRTLCEHRSLPLE